MQFKTINVLIICYNQERLIGRTLDSILQQKEWGLHQIIIGDDCSIDGTLDVLMDYKRRYPDIIYPLPNEKNLGIYGNMERVAANRGVADLYLHLAGDDTILDGYFKATQEFIARNHVDTTGAVGIYSDWKLVRPDGTESLRKQDAILSNYKPWSLYMHGRVCNRSLLISGGVMECIQPLILDKGIGLAECMYDSQIHSNISKAFYMPVVSSVYYSNIGVSITLNEGTYKTKQARIKYQFILDNYAKEVFDISQAQYGIARCDFIEHPTLVSFFKMILYYEKGQLPGLRNTMKYTISMFGSLFKNHILKRDNLC